MKKSITILLSCIVLCMMFTAVSFAAEKESGTNIKLSDKQLLLYPKEEKTKITLQGDYDLKKIKKIDAYSNNEDVVTVDWTKGKDYGTIHVQGKGYAVVKVDIYGRNDGEYELIKSIKCKVAVAKKPAFESKTHIIPPDEKPYIFTIKNAPKGLTPKYYSTDKSVAKVNKNGKVTPKGEGTCKICAKFGHKTISAKVTVKWMPNYKINITSINKNKCTVKFKVSNLGKKPIKLINDYDTTLYYDNSSRANTLVGKKVIVVKPGKTRTITYEVFKSKLFSDKIDGPTNDAYISHKIIFEGKTYDAFIARNVEDSAFKYSKKAYYHTYYNTGK